MEGWRPDLVLIGRLVLMIDGEDKVSRRRCGNGATDLMEED